MDALGLVAAGGPALARVVADAGAMEPLGERHPFNTTPLPRTPLLAITCSIAGAMGPRGP